MPPQPPRNDNQRRSPTPSRPEPENTEEEDAEEVPYSSYPDKMPEDDLRPLREEEEPEQPAFEPFPQETAEEETEEEQTDTTEETEESDGELGSDEDQQAARRQLEGNRLQYLNQPSGADEEQERIAAKQAAIEAENEASNEEARKRLIRRISILAFLFNPITLMFLTGACVILMIVTFVGATGQNLSGGTPGA